MAKITWDDRTNSGEESKISASIFNEIKNSVNAIYDDDVSLSGSIFISGSIIPNADNNYTSSFDLGSPTAAWGEIYVATSSLNFVDTDGTITKWSKADVTKLRSGKSISTVAGKQLVNENDDTTYVRMSSAGRAVHYVSNKPTIDLKPEVLTLGNLAGQTTGTPIAMPGGITGSLTITGSTNITGSTSITGSTNITGSFSTLPPPPIANAFPITNTLFYGYTFDDLSSVEAMFADANVNAASSLNRWRFSTSSQNAFGGQTPTDRTSFFLNLAQSASNAKLATITFNPNTQPEWNYVYKVSGISSVVNNGPDFTVTVDFVESSSTNIDYPTPNSLIPTSGGGANGKFTFLIPDTAEPTSGYATGDLLNLLSTFGQTGVPSGSLGDINFNGAVNVNDLLLLLGGYGNPNTLCSNITYNANTNYSLAGPVISVCDGTYVSIQDGAFVNIT